MAVAMAVPARADYNFTPSFPSIPAVDICVFGDCTFLGQLTTGINEYNHIRNDIQQAEMMVQNLKNGPSLGMLQQLGVLDPSSAQLLNALHQAAAGANPTQSAMSIASMLQTNGQQNSNDLNSLANAMQSQGVGTLSAQQIESVVLQKIAGSQEASNQLQAAAMMQQQANVQQTYKNMSEELDLNSPATAGWKI
jgi:hypothetical protein